jgi:DNA-binding transcriptional LysR family regulator
MATERDIVPDLSSNELRAVVAVAEYRSFVAAAASLKISQPALTRRIKQVEQELRVTLFSRSTRHVSVTEAGKRFASHAERLLKDLKISADNAREVAKSPRGQVVVSSVLSLANAILPALIAGYNRRFPAVEIHLREGLHNAVRDDVRSGLADFGVGYVDDPPSAFATEKLGVEALYLVMPADHPIAGRRSIELHDLVEMPFVSFPSESRTRRTIDGAAATAGLSFNYVMTANRLPTLHGLVRNRVGLAVVPASERPAGNDKELASRPLIGRRLSCQIGVMRLRERELSPAAAELVSVVRKWLRHQARSARR